MPFRFNKITTVRQLEAPTILHHYHVMCMQLAPAYNILVFRYDINVSSTGISMIGESVAQAGESPTWTERIVKKLRQVELRTLTS